MTSSIVAKLVVPTWAPSSAAFSSVIVVASANSLSSMTTTVWLPK